MFLSRLTRDQIEVVAPLGTVVLPTASIEQHGPHLPIEVDTVLCNHVAERAVAKAQKDLTVGNLWLAPINTWGNSHHHRPFSGVLSLTSEHYVDCVSDILEGLYLAGFRRIFILNGHGGNSAPNSMATQDFVNRRGFVAHVGAANYWDIGRDALVKSNLIDNQRIPGHAGEFETALMLSIDPGSVSEAGMKVVKESPDLGKPIYKPLSVSLESKGAFATQGGFTDDPAKGTAAQGQAMMEIIIAEAARVLMAFHELPTIG